MSIVRKDSKPIENNIEGAYLTFDPASHGTLLLTWSKNAVQTAFIHFLPHKPVANFKFTTNQGRSELMRECQMEPRKYFQGWCAFLKMVKQFDGEVTLIDDNGPIKTDVFLHRREGNDVIKMELGHAYELESVDAVAVVPRDNAELSAKSLTLTPILFIEKGERVGAAAMC